MYWPCRKLSYTYVTLFLLHLAAIERTELSVAEATHSFKIWKTNDNDLSLKVDLPFRPFRYWCGLNGARLEMWLLYPARPMIDKQNGETVCQVKEGKFT